MYFQHVCNHLNTRWLCLTSDCFGFSVGSAANLSKYRKPIAKLSQSVTLLVKARQWWKSVRNLSKLFMYIPCIFHVCLVYDCFRPRHFEGAQSQHKFHARSVNCEVALPKSDAWLPYVAINGEYQQIWHVHTCSVCECVFTTKTSCSISGKIFVVLSLAMLYRWSYISLL